MLRKRWIRRLAISAVALGAAAYLAAVVYVKVREPELVFTRVATPDGLPAPADSLALPVEVVRFVTEDSVRLTSWVIRSADTASGLWVLLCHGQSGNITTNRRPEYYAYLRAIGVNILALEWRGFGASEGTPTEDGLYRDATAGYEYLRQTLRVPADSIIIFGHSLGTGPATELATRVPAAALILEGGPTSVANRGQELYPLLPIRLIASAQFPTIERIPHISLPMLFFHAREDRRIPFAHGQALYAAAKRAKSKRFVELEGAHHNAFFVDREVYFREYADFVANLRKPGSR